MVDLLRIYLLCGLVAHKALWEAMKRTQPGVRKPAQPPRLKLVKAIKIAVLLGIVAQTFLPDVLPISPDPTALRATGVVLYTFGLAIAMTGRLQLGSNWLDIESAGVMREQVVVSSGLYRFIRHPIYSGDLLLLFGLELALNSSLAILVLVLAPIVLRQAIREERMLLRSLPGYDKYCRRTKRFIPFLA